MGYQIEKRKKPLKIILLVLTIVSIVAFFVSKMAYFEFWGVTMTTVFWSFIQVSPLLMLLIYVIVSNKTEKGKKLISFVFMVIVSSTLLPYLYDALYWGNFYFTDGIYFYLDVFVIVPSFVVAMIYGFKGKLNKVFIIIGCSIAFLSDSYALLENFNDMMHNARYFFSPSYNLSMSNIYFCLSFMLFYVVVFILGITAKNTAQEPQVAQEFVAEPQVVRALTPEQMLVALREQFELGIISEEEYLSRRDEIIKELLK